MYDTKAIKTHKLRVSFAFWYASSYTYTVLGYCLKNDSLFQGWYSRKPSGCPVSRNTHYPSSLQDWHCSCLDHPRPLVTWNEHSIPTVLLFNYPLIGMGALTFANQVSVLLKVLEISFWDAILLMKFLIRGQEFVYFLLSSFILVWAVSVGYIKVSIKFHSLWLWHFIKSVRFKQATSGTNFSSNKYQLP